MIVRLETSIFGQRLSIAHHAGRPHMGHDAPDYQYACRQANSRASQRGSGVGSCRLERNKKASVVLRMFGGKPSAAFVHDLTPKAFDAGSIASDRIRELQEDPVDRRATSIRRPHRAPPERTWHRLRARIRGRSQGARFSVAVACRKPSVLSGCVCWWWSERSFNPVSRRKALAYGHARIRLQRLGRTVPLAHARQAPADPEAQP